MKGNKTKRDKIWAKKHMNYMLWSFEGGSQGARYYCLQQMEYARSILYNQ